MLNLLFIFFVYFNIFFLCKEFPNFVMTKDEQMSINLNDYVQISNLSIETDNPIERGRKSGVPVGLKNIGNSKNN